MDKTKFLVKTAKILMEKESPVIHIFRPHRFQLRNALNSLSCWSSVKDDKYFLFNGAHILNEIPKEDPIYHMNPVQIVHGMDIFNCKGTKKDIFAIEDMTSLVVEAFIQGQDPEDQANRVASRLNELQRDCHKLLLTSKSFYGMRYLLSKLDFPVTDVSFNKEWASLCGFTQDELTKFIIPKLKSHPFFHNQNDIHILNMVHQSVGGYNFGNEVVTHPTLTQQFASDPVTFYTKPPQIYNKTQLSYLKKMLPHEMFQAIWVAIHEETILNWSWDELSTLDWKTDRSNIAVKVLFEMGLLASVDPEKLQLKFSNMFARRYFDQVLVPFLNK